MQKHLIIIAKRFHHVWEIQTDITRSLLSVFLMTPFPLGGFTQYRVTSILRNLGENRFKTHDVPQFPLLDIYEYKFRPMSYVHASMQASLELIVG